jgi:hypothetical protein
MCSSKTQRSTMIIASFLIAAVFSLEVTPSQEVFEGAGTFFS